MASTMATAISAAVRAWVALSPKIEPNSTVTPAVPLAVAAGAGVEGQEEHAESQHPGEDAADDHVVGASPRPSTPISSEIAMVAPNRPSRLSSPKASAPSAPVNATWLSASLVKHLRPQHQEVADQPQASAIAVPARNACCRNGGTVHVGLSTRSNLGKPCRVASAVTYTVNAIVVTRSRSGTA